MVAAFYPDSSSSHRRMARTFRVTTNTGLTARVQEVYPCFRLSCRHVGQRGGLVDLKPLPKPCVGRRRPGRQGAAEK